MGPELTTNPRTRSCPTCGASVRLDADWCGQCYADLRPPAPPETPPPHTSADGSPAVDALQGPLHDLIPSTPYAAPLPLDAPGPAALPIAATPAAEPTWPCLTCTAANPLSASSCSNCGNAFLAAVAQESRTTLVLPLVGDLGAMSRGKRLALAGGLVAAILVPLALLTLLLTQSPPNGSGTTPDGTTVTSTP